MKIIPPHLEDHDCPEHLRITRMFVIRAQQENEFLAYMEEKRDYTEIIAKINEMYYDGTPVTEIASILDFSPSTIYRFIVRR